MTLPQVIRDAILSGPIPRLRSMDDIRESYRRSRAAEPEAALALARG